MNPNKSCNFFLVQALIHRCSLQVELVHTLQVRLAPDKLHVHTLQVTVRFLSVVMFPDMSCTSTWNTGAVPFSMIISSSGLTCKTLGKPCKKWKRIQCATMASLISKDANYPIHNLTLFECLDTNSKS